MSTVALERGWLGLDREAVSALVGRLVRSQFFGASKWASEEPKVKDVVGPVKLREGELVEILNGVHGEDVQAKFVLAIVGGISVAPGGSVYEPFADACLRHYGQDLLRDVALADVTLKGHKLAGIAWQDMLGSMVGRRPHESVYDKEKSKIEASMGSLYRSALSAGYPLSDELRLKALSMMLELNDEHHDIHEILLSEGHAAALMSNALMTHRLKSQRDSTPSEAPAPPRRRASL